MNATVRVAAVATLVVATALSGCNGDKKADETPSTTPTLVTAAPPTNQPEGAAKDLTEVTCAADKDGSWSFSAKLANTSGGESTYTVRVSIVKKVGSTVVAAKQVKKTLKDGDSTTIELKDFTKQKNSDDLLCVPTTTVER